MIIFSLLFRDILLLRDCSLDGDKLALRYCFLVGDGLFLPDFALVGDTLVFEAYFLGGDIVFLRDCLLLVALSFRAYIGGSLVSRLSRELSINSNSSLESNVDKRCSCP